MPPKKFNKKRTQVPIHVEEEEEERDKKRRDFEEEIQKKCKSKWMMILEFPFIGVIKPLYMLAFLFLNL
jgi:hypothetical protein